MHKFVLAHLTKFHCTEVSLGACLNMLFHTNVFFLRYTVLRTSDTQFSPLDAELIYRSPSTECAVPIKWHSAFKGLDLMKKKKKR